MLPWEFMSSCLSTRTSTNLNSLNLFNYFFTPFLAHEYSSALESIFWKCGWPTWAVIASHVKRRVEVNQKQASPPLPPTQLLLSLGSFVRVFLYKYSLHCVIYSSPVLGWIYLGNHNYIMQNKCNVLLMLDTDFISEVLWVCIVTLPCLTTNSTLFYLNITLEDVKGGSVS